MDIWVIVTIIIMVLAGGFLFFLVDSAGYIKWSLNPETLKCKECPSPSCYLEDCNNTVIAQAANTTAILNLICPTCQTCPVCPTPLNITTTNLNMTYSYYNETNDLISSGKVDFLGLGIYNISIENRSVTITVGQ